MARQVVISHRLLTHAYDILSQWLATYMPLSWSTSWTVKTMALEGMRDGNGMGDGWGVDVLG